MSNQIQMNFREFSESMIILSHDPETQFNASSFKVLAETMPYEENHTGQLMYLEYTSFSMWMWWFNASLYFKNKLFFDNLLNSFKKDSLNMIEQLEISVKFHDYSVKKFYMCRKNTYIKYFVKGDMSQIEKVFRYHMEQAWAGNIIKRELSYPFDDLLNMPTIEPLMFTKPFIHHFFTDMNKIFKNLVVT